MSGERLEPLDAELAALVEAERQRPELPAAAQQQLWAGLAQAIGGGGGGPGPGGGGGHGTGMGGGGGLGTAGRMGRFFARRIPFGVTAFTIGGLAGAGLHATWTARPQPGALVAQRSVEAPPPLPVNVPLAPSAAPLIAPVAPPPASAAPVMPPPASAAEPVRRRAAHVSAPATDEGERDTELATERTLVETARTALARGDLGGALELLERHAVRFAHGRLAEERDSLRVQALAKAGRGPEARALAANFYQQYPNSMLRPLVDAALAAIP